MPYRNIFRTPDRQTVGNQPDNYQSREGQYRGTAVFQPWISIYGERGHMPEPEAHNGLLPWMSLRHIDHTGRSVQLDYADVPALTITQFSATMHRPTIDRGLYQQGDSRALDVRGWAWNSRAIVRQKYVNVPLWTVLGPPRATSGLNWQPARRPQPAAKANALAIALQRSSAALQRAQAAFLTPNNQGG